MNSLKQSLNRIDEKQQKIKHHHQWNISYFMQFSEHKMGIIFTESLMEIHFLVEYP